MTSRALSSLAAIVFATALVRCTTNNTVIDPSRDGGDGVTAEALCTKLSKMSCGQSISACTTSFDTCAGSDADKQAMLDCMSSATFACTGALPTTSSCAEETSRACPANGADASTNDAHTDLDSATPPPSGVCGGLCTPGLVADFDCKDSGGFTYVFSLAVGNDGSMGRMPACVEANGYVYRCDQTLFINGSQTGTWALSGKSLAVTKGGAAYTCTKR